MQPLYWLSNYTDTEITDPDFIAKLENDEIDDGSSITRPVDMDKLDPEFRAELERRLKEER